DHLAIVLRGQGEGGLEFAGVVGLGNAHRRAEISRLDEHRERQLAAGVHDVGAIAHDGRIFDNWQHPFLTDTFHHLLVHGDGGCHDAGADVRQAGQFQQSLHGAVLAEGAVQHRKNHVDAGVGAGLGQNRARAPLALFVYEVLDLLVLSRVQPGQDGLGRTDRDFVLAVAAAVNYGYSYFHKMRFPNPDTINSTARSAVRFRSSITGFTSTTSIETICPESQIISRAKWASRYVAPPRTGVPTPGASTGSQKSMSSERWSPAVPAVAMRMASSITVRRPRSSMSRMVKARMPLSRTCGFSAASTSRNPTMTAWRGSILGR